MNNEFKQINNGNEVRYVLEDGGATTTGAIATVEKPLGELQRRAEPAKPRNFVAKNAKMGGAGQHKDKKKAEKQGDVKHKKPFMEDSHPDEKEDKVLIRKMVKRDALKKEGYGQGGYETAMASKIQPGQGPNMESDGDVDQELGMAGSELYGIAKHAKELLALIHQQGQEHGLEAWQQSKITKAADYLTAVLQSMDYDANGEQGVEEDDGISKDAETNFHSKLDRLVHNTFGKRKSEQGMAEDPYFNMLERSVSQAQHNLMVGVAHNPQFAQKVQVKQSVGKEFADADKGHDIKALPVRVPKKK